MHRLWILAAILLFGACGGGDKSFDVGPGGSNPDLADVAVYRPASPYAGVLKDCATAGSLNRLCTMQTLPLVGQAAAAPTAADVMDRVLVSHPWMALRFEEVLNQLPPDILTLFKGVTAVVIDADIRPSFYSSGTAAIYLDPANLWLTNEEKATIAQDPDFRSGFGAELQFVTLSRYVQNNSYAYAFFPLDGTETRQLSDLVYPMARLLYHELAHANDFLPPAAQPLLDRQLTPHAARQALANESVAAELVLTSPLTSLLWQSLAQVLFLGVPATAEQASFPAGLVGVHFAGDGATDAYGYSTIHEDVAMLFEETMMKYHFGIDRDVAFSDLPVTDLPVCDDYLVQWGVRSRIGDAAVKPRAEGVAAALLPDADLTAFLAGLPAATPMPAGVGWCANLTLGAVAPLGLAAGPTIHPDQVRQDRLPPD
jgi:hypothetical protein